MKCFKCDKTIKKDKYNLLNKAIEFQGHLSYGSKFDTITMDGNDYLEIFICDSCLEKNIKKIKRYRVQITKKKEYSKKVL